MARSFAELRRAAVKRCLLPGCLLLASLLFAFAVAEGLAQAYVYGIAKKGKMFKPDPVLGWKVLPDLDMMRRNADGALWHLATNADGSRSRSFWNESTLVKILILGDSFAFGEGVDLEDRFDTLLETSGLAGDIVNLGVMGYGTDQQMIVARDYFPVMEAGDLVILLTHSNDFHDILRKTHSGRAKPRFSLTDDRHLVEHPVRLTWREELRDRSYIFASVMSWFQRRREFTRQDLARSTELYRAIVLKEMEEVLHEGIYVLIAYHGLFDLENEEGLQIVRPAMEGLCSQRSRIDCLWLDPFLEEPNGTRNFLSDRHWSREGHRVVADVIGNYLTELRRDPLNAFQGTKNGP